MAENAIGKLKGLTSGLGERFQRILPGRKTRADEDEYVEGYDAGEEGEYERPYDQADSYDDGYADDGYADDDYGADDGYEDDGYADDDYAADDGYDDGYDDDGYGDDGYADDGYDDGYDDDGYGDDGYDDRYSDEDAGEGGYYGDESPILRYVDEHDWVTYALLFLLPPLGIYLLWRRNRFDKPIRYAVSAASAIWFIVALILIFSALLGGGDEKVTPSITIPPLTATPTAAPEDETTVDDSTLIAIDGTSDPLNPSPSATPLASGDDTASVEYVYSPPTGLYYHSTDTCSNIDETVKVSLSRVPLSVAQETRKQSACPVCIGGGTTQIYYATRGGKYYHLDPTCSGMENAESYTQEAAEMAGKEACPVCVTQTQTSLNVTEAPTGNTKLISASTQDQSGISVYYTKNGSYYHVKSNCSGMKGAAKDSLKNALLAGKGACPTCCPSAGTTVYCTAGGKSYHVNKTCQGMKGASAVTLAEAMVLGKSKCTVCIKGKASANNGTTTVSAQSGLNAYVYATRGGTYYHTNATCSGMKGAGRYTLAAMLAQNRKACPKCATNATTVVYTAKGGSYYHSYATCSGMVGATAGTMAKAMAAGYKRCPRCWNTKSDDTSTTTTTTTTAATGTTKIAASKTATASNTYVYCTRTGSYYHTRSNCSGMAGASRVTLRTAIKQGKTACPTCATAANRVVYSTSNGKNYHAASTCASSGMKNGTKRTLAQALMLNQTACQYCLGTGKTTTAATTTVKAATTYKNGKSGIKVYATTTGRYFHTKSTCSGMTSAVRVSLETALNNGKAACPTCASSARRTVYAVSGGKYYHYSKSDAGSGAKSGTLASALAFGYQPCPTCVTKTAKATRTTYKSGTSGIKVYATTNGRYYHAKASCSGMTNGTRITLETALNNGKTACPVCLSSASRKVYSKTGDKYYHYTKAHAGSGAKAGTIAAAKAYGLKACPTCTKTSDGAVTTDNGGSPSAPVSTVKYSASGDSKVYINIASANNYYHKASKCTKAKFSGGTAVTLQYVKDWGYKACPYCNPPTSVTSGTEM